MLHPIRISGATLGPLAALLLAWLAVPAVVGAGFHAPVVETSGMTGEASPQETRIRAATATRTGIRTVCVSSAPGAAP